MDAEISGASVRYSEYRANLQTEVAVGFVTHCLGRSLLKYIENEDERRIITACLSHGLLAIRTILDFKIVTEDDFIAAVQLVAQRLHDNPTVRGMVQDSLYRFLEIENATSTPTQCNPSGQAG